MLAVPSEPPQHMVTNASSLSVRSSSCSAVVIRRDPVEPTGWPSAIAPPFTFTRSRSGLCTWAQLTHDRGERLVDLEDVEVRHRHPGAVEHLVGRVDGPVEQVVRVGPGDELVQQPRPGLEPERLGPVLVHPEHRRRAVGDL